MVRKYLENEGEMLRDKIKVGSAGSRDAMPLCWSVDGRWISSWRLRREGQGAIPCTTAPAICAGVNRPGMMVWALAGWRCPANNPYSALPLLDKFNVEKEGTYLITAPDHFTRLIEQWRVSLA